MKGDKKNKLNSDNLKEVTPITQKKYTRHCKYVVYYRY